MKTNHLTPDTMMRGDLPAVARLDPAWSQDRIEAEAKVPSTRTRVVRSTNEIVGYSIARTSPGCTHLTVDRIVCPGWGALDVLIMAAKADVAYDTRQRAAKGEPALVGMVLTIPTDAVEANEFLRDEHGFKALEFLRDRDELLMVWDIEE